MSIFLILGIIIVVSVIVGYLSMYFEGPEFIGYIAIAVLIFAVFTFLIVVPVSILATAKVNMYNQINGTEYTWNEWVLYKDILQQNSEGIKVRLE